LAAEIGWESSSGLAKSQQFAKVGLEGFGHLGMPVGHRGKIKEEGKKISRGKSLKSLELFAGAGGLALGTARAGFAHQGVFEWNPHACATIRHNQQRKVKPVSDWPMVHPADVCDLNFRPFEGIALLSGGPPCQPFSIGGKHRGHSDNRNLFPQVVRAVRESRPRAVLVENVKGILRPAFANFVQYIKLQLTYPEVSQNENEAWEAHLSRLEKYHTGGRVNGLSYNVVIRKTNAADFGVPQKRERVFFVGFRSDLSPEWSFPEPTHSRDALLRDQWDTGEYWERHKITKRNRPEMPNRCRSRVEGIRSQLFPIPTGPWRTVRDSITDLPDARKPMRTNRILNHNFNPGARSYLGHTGSPFDEPAKTLKAGDHGVPGGENMLRYPDGDVRYFTIRESARLQTFPDEYAIEGSWSEAMRQLGNAVPVELAHIVAKSIHQKLKRG
jgi:DNA (cytosine-5)-methyltransferase 1